MKRVYYAGIFIFFCIAIAHVIVWFINHDIHAKQVVQYEAIGKKEYHFLKKERLKLESEQEKSLERYQRLDKGSSYVQIPIERAFDYYLRANAK